MLQNDNIRIGCLYAYHNQVLVEFDKQAKEQVKIIGRNGNKKRKGRKLKYNNAKQELEELEKEMDKYRRNELVNFMDTVFVDLRVPHADRPALCLDRASNSGSKPESVPKTGRKS